MSNIGLVIILDQEKGQGGMKKGQGGRRASSNMYYYKTRQKTLRPYQISFSFMTLKEMHCKNLENKGENTGYVHFSFSSNVLFSFRYKSLHLSFFL